MRIVFASEAGAALDSNLLRGGGTDDTAALQAVLDRASNGTPIHLVIDGAALVSGLNVYGNTTIEGTAGGGLYLRDGSSRAIIRNAHRSRGQITDEHVTIRGLFLNGNREHQPGTETLWRDIGGLPQPIPSNKESDGTFISGLQFLGINYLTIDNVTLWNVRAFGALIGNASRINITNVLIDHGGGPDADLKQYGNTDGFHFKGPLRYLNMDGVRLRTGDDGIALNPNDFDTDDLTLHNDFGPYVGQGPITDVTICNVQLMDVFLGMRILSATERVDRILVTNVTGTTRGGYLANISHLFIPDSLGNVGSILIDRVNVERAKAPAFPTEIPSEMIEKLDSEVRARIENELYAALKPMVAVNGHVEYLALHRIMTRVDDDRPVLWCGPDAHVKMLEAELSIFDPELQAVPLELRPGARIDHLKLSLNWKGNARRAAKNPIASPQGTIGELEWGHPPMGHADSST